MPIHYEGPGGCSSLFGVGRLLGGNFPFEPGMCQDDGHLGIGGAEELGAFRTGIDLGKGIFAAGEDAAQFDLFGLEAGYGGVEISQLLFVLHFHQGLVEAALVGEGLCISRHGGIIAQRLGMDDHLGGCIDAGLDLIRAYPGW